MISGEPLLGRSSVVGKLPNLPNIPARPALT
jgi:hypothetical protein